MSYLRVTAGTTAARGIANIDSAASRLAKLQDQLSSGKQITTPSDNPTGTVQALQLRGQVQRNDQYATNSSDAIAWLSTANSTYNQVVTVLQSARTLVLKGLNTGASDTAAIQTIATQIGDIRTSLFGLANTSYNGRPIFGGTTAEGVAYDSTTGLYQGDLGVASRAVGPNSTVSVTATGPSVFGDDTSGVFGLLQGIKDALNTVPSTLSGDALTQLDSAISTVSAAQSNEGATYQRVQIAQTGQTATSTALQTQLSSVEDIDVAKLAVQVATANTAYQAALQTTASIRQLSLLDFLK